MFDFDASVELALRTWYPKDHELHLNPHHPLGKLIGEWGELLDDYMKSIYKPGYIFEPIDELGDISYYLRILAYQGNHTLYEIGKNEGKWLDKSTEYLIASVVGRLCQLFEQLETDKHIQNLYFWDLLIDMSYSALVEILERNNITLQQLIDNNWEKLKPGSERGEQWAKARLDTDYVYGKVTKR